MTIDIRLNWTPNQWRHFLGQADTTPLVELVSAMLDGVFFYLIQQRIATLGDDDSVSSVQPARVASGLSATAVDRAEKARIDVSLSPSRSR